MSEVQRRSVQCRDVANRPGAVAVVKRDQEAVLIAPPGEVARMTVPQLTQLIEALRAVRDELFRTES